MEKQDVLHGRTVGMEPEGKAQAVAMFDLLQACLPCRLERCHSHEPETSRGEFVESLGEGIGGLFHPGILDLTADSAGEAFRVKGGKVIYSRASFTGALERFLGLLAEGGDH